MAAQGIAGVEDFRAAFFEDAVEGFEDGFVAEVGAADSDADEEVGVGLDFRGVGFYARELGFGGGAGGCEGGFGVGAGGCEGGFGVGWFGRVSVLKIV